MNSKFSIEVWRSYYDRVNSIGSKVKEAAHDLRDHGVCDLNKPEMENMIEACNEIVKESEKYMNDNDISASTPLWIYSPKDETTWISSPLFAYWNLVR